MKKLILLSFLFLGGLNISAQIQDLWVADSINTCSQSGVSLSFYVGSLDEVDPSITIYWGDGTTDVLNTGTFLANNYSAIDFYHNYQNPGTYTIYSTFVSSVNSQLYTSSSLQTSFFGDNLCGHVYGNVYQTSNCGAQGNWNYDPTYDLIDAFGNVTNFSGLLNGVNVTATPYTLSINDNWLQQNNLTQLTSDVTILTFDQYGWPDFNANLNFQVGSLNLNQEPDYLFSSSYAYGLSPLEEFRLYLQLINQNCGTSGTTRVSLIFPLLLVPNTNGLLNAVVNGNTLTFDVLASNLNSWNYITFYMPGTTPAGTEFEFSASVIDLSTSEINTSNNLFNFTGVVFNSYDPNNKLVNRGQNINPNEQEELIYTINFQNEGNFDALNVKISDTISVNLDLSTFHVIDSKHDVVTNINPSTGLIEFRFDQINLAPKDQDEEGSKGFVTYVIKEKANLPVDSEIENTAYIYFDFNPAIITNTTFNKNSMLSASQLEDIKFNIYPNPVKNKLTVESNKATNELILMDLNGKIILKQKIGFKEQVDVSAVENGVYYLQMMNENTNSIQKVIVNK